ncbi:hypothetical protein M885DRAFT_516409 [Pelagophyceae sp. CCMP2097]|nr:hypothetical protein M885DRAFT_516409 [Pelagophyceae sp. CCMP2097]
MISRAGALLRGSGPRVGRPTRAALRRGGLRCFSLDGDDRRRWSELEPGRRYAWETLGWTAARWDGGGGVPPLSELSSWAELTPQQRAAALHGLAYTPAGWDAEDSAHLASSAVSVADAESRAAARGGGGRLAPVDDGRAPDGAAATLAGAMIGLAPLAARALNLARSTGLVPRRHADALRMAESWLQVGSTAADGLMGTVQLRGVENAIYLDDSGSMSPRLLSIGTALYKAMAQRLHGQQTRVVKFGWDRTVLERRSVSPPADRTAALWDASSGGTVMWRAIREDVLGTWKPGGGKLRLWVYTDGFDSETGIDGMHPMMESLTRAGLDVEFHIIILRDAAALLGGGAVSASDAKKYEALALSTGGSVVSINADGNALSNLSAIFGGGDDAKVLQRLDVRGLLDRVSARDSDVKARALARGDYERKTDASFKNAARGWTDRAKEIGG